MAEFINDFFTRSQEKNLSYTLDNLSTKRPFVIFVIDLKNDVIQDVERKIASLDKRAGMSIRPVLIHVNGVEEGALAEDFFAEIITDSMPQAESEIEAVS